MPSLLRLGIHSFLFRDLLDGLRRYKEYSKTACMTRIAEGTSQTKSDVMGLVLRAQSPTGTTLFNTAEMISEASLLIITGSDKTSTAISSTIFYMLHFSTTLAGAQTEVRSTFHSLEEIRAGSKLNSCIYLRACIDEALRMSPPVGGLLARQVRAGSLLIDGEFLPEGTEVGTPIYAIHHCERYFPDSYTYKPERWLDADEETRIKMAGCFMAFSTGPRGCVGKAMAMQEYMTVLGRLLWMYEWRLKEGSTLGGGKVGLRGARWRRDEYQLWDTFFSECDGPEVEFKSRSI
jgi:cytochrome P450